MRRYQLTPISAHFGGASGLHQLILNYSTLSVFALNEVIGPHWDNLPWCDRLPDSTKATGRTRSKAGETSKEDSNELLL
jgi:hypothetical protein